MLNFFSQILFSVFLPLFFFPRIFSFTLQNVFNPFRELYKSLDQYMFSLIKVIINNLKIEVSDIPQAGFCKNTQCYVTSLISFQASSDIVDS